MVYVALLRGINVGGNNKVDMKRLKAAMEEAGLSHVVTYINSGNIIFTSNQADKHALAGVVENVISETFGLVIKVLIRSLDDYEAMMKALPESWQNNDEMRSDVLFLWEEVDQETVLDQLVFKPELETVMYTPGAVLWSISRAISTKSGLSKIIGTRFYSKVTIRNVNTTRKIYELMKEAAVKESL
ncbi:DUF1697 domain-containing protein [Paenibacillus sp. CAU 1782]